MTEFLTSLYDTREEVIFWVLLTCSIVAVATGIATFLEGSGFVATAYGMLLAKQAHSRKWSSPNGHDK